jgi:hypothetical protein
MYHPEDMMHHASSSLMTTSSVWLFGKILRGELTEHPNWALSDHTPPNAPRDAGASSAPIILEIGVIMHIINRSLTKWLLGGAITQRRLTSILLSSLLVLRVLLDISFGIQNIPIALATDCVNWVKHIATRVETRLHPFQLSSLESLQAKIGLISRSNNVQLTIP